MSRTSAASVKAVLLKDYDSEDEPDLDPFIEAAGMFVDEARDLAIAASTPMSGARLRVIETWAAAHLYACSDRPYDKRTIDRDSYQMSGVTGKGFQATLYGQQAISLDSSNYLRTVGGSEDSSGGGGSVQVASLSGDAGINQTNSGNVLGAPIITPSAANLSILAATVTVNGMFIDSIAANNSWQLGLGAVGHTQSASATQAVIAFDTLPQSTGNLMAVLTNGNGTSEEAQIATVI